MARRRLKLFFDGGCRPNPGPMEAAVVLRGAVHLFGDMGQGTNTDAEWLALIRAMELAHSLGLALMEQVGVELIGDALPVIHQANEALRSGQPIAGPMRAHSVTFLALAAKAPPARLRWIKREQNLAGIALAARHPR